MRVRAAGYWIYVCDDVFIHHFGSRSFAANNVDYMATMNENWARFAKKWGMSGPLPTQGYRGGQAHARGFVRSKHYLAFPPVRDAEAADAAAVATLDREASFAKAKALFGIAVRREEDWSVAAQFVRRFAQAFKVEDGVQLSIGAFGDPRAHTIASRVERILEKAGVTPETCADIDIADYDDEAEWSDLAGDARFVDITSLTDRSPSALRRIVREVSP
jgi:hypothetical protein